MAGGVGAGIAAGEAETVGAALGGQRDILGAVLRRASLAPGEPGGVEQHNAEEDGEAAHGDAGGEEGSEERSEGGRDLEKHADANVGVALTDVGGGSAGAGGDDRDQRGANRVTEIDVEDGGEEGDEDNAAAETCQ